MINKEKNLLNEEQARVVKEKIIESMRDVYLDGGVPPDDFFYEASGKIADKIIKNVQNELEHNSPMKIYSTLYINGKKVGKTTVRKAINKGKVIMAGPLKKNGTK